jgi:RimJ/RimL family protein N-acetyltransferase
MAKVDGGAGVTSAAAEALQAIIALARWRNLTELVASVHPENRASVRVLERAGFQPGSGSEQACCTFCNLPQELQGTDPTIPKEYLLQL